LFGAFQRTLHSQAIAWPKRAAPAEEGGRREQQAQAIVCRWAGGCFRAMSADDERDAEHWRQLEAEARTIAAAMTDPEPRRIMFFIAEGYKLLADRAEHRKTQND